MTLTLTVPFHRDESVTSLASRLAARNRFQSVRHFSFAFDLNFSDLVGGEPKALNRLAELSGADLAALNRTAFVRGDGRNFTLNGERLAPGLLQRMSLVVCPHCVMEALTGGYIYDAFSPSMVEITSIRTCAKHNTPLHLLMRGPPAQMSHDLVVLLKDRVEEVDRLAQDASTRLPSSLERYLMARLDAGSSGSNWVDRLGFSAVARASEMLGAVIAFGRKVLPKRLTSADWAKAGGLGFGVLASGQDALVDWVDSATRSPDIGGLSRAQDILGPALNSWLTVSPDPDVAPIREIVRDALLDRLPLPAGALLLGQPVNKRRTHSVFSASREFGVHVLTVRKVLAAGGYLHDHSISAADNRVIIRPGGTQLLARYAEGISQRDIRTYLNTTRPQAQVIAARYLTPIVVAEGVAPFFHPSDLDRFLDRLSSRARPVPVAPQGACTIGEATLRANRSLVDIVDPLYNGKLAWIGTLEGVPGFGGLLVNLEEIKEVTKLPPLPGRTTVELAREMGIPPAALTALIKAKVVRSEIVVHPVHRCPVTIVPFEECDVIFRQKISRRDAALARGVWNRHIDQILKSEGIAPDPTWAAHGAVVYNRADLA